MIAASCRNLQPEPSTVLVVEDEILVRMTIADHLRDRRLHVVEAGNGEEGLAILRSGIPVHLLISDISMPGSIDGILLAKLAKRDYGLPVILVSALDRVAVPVGIADAFFEKPYDLNRIFAMATELLDDGKQ